MPLAEDPELVALPAPPKRERTITVAFMLVTAVAGLLMAFLLRGEAMYAFSGSQPTNVGDLASLQLDGELNNRYVRAHGMLGTSGAIRYGRAAEGDSFRLAPVAGHDKLWIEIRVPEGFEGPRFVPPTSFAGRLVRLDEAGIRNLGLRDAVGSHTDHGIPSDAWVLVDGSSPRASRWALALCIIFTLFAFWNVAGIVRLLKRAPER